MAIGRTNHGSDQRPPARADGWTAARRATFLSTLAETSNVRLAAAACGKTTTSCHALRRRDAPFAASWQAALVEARERLQAEMVGVALGQVARAGAPAGGDAAADAAPADLGLALRVLQLPSVRGDAAPADHRPCSMADTDARLMRKLAAMARQRGCEA